MKNEPAKLDQQMIRREQIAGEKERALRSFFKNLSPKAKREIRKAYYKVEGRKESTAEMMVRLQSK
jgi:hypothetical protein